MATECDGATRRSTSIAATTTRYTSATADGPTRLDPGEDRDHEQRDQVEQPHELQDEQSVGDRRSRGVPRRGHRKRATSGPVRAVASLRVTPVGPAVHREEGRDRQQQRTDHGQRASGAGRQQLAGGRRSVGHAVGDAPERSEHREPVETLEPASAARRTDLRTRGTCGAGAVARHRRRRTRRSPASEAGAAAAASGAGPLAAAAGASTGAGGVPAPELVTPPDPAPELEPEPVPAPLTSSSDFPPVPCPPTSPRRRRARGDLPLPASRRRGRRRPSSPPVPVDGSGARPAAGARGARVGLGGFFPGHSSASPASPTTPASDAAGGVQPRASSQSWPGASGWTRRRRCCR